MKRVMLYSGGLDSYLLAWHFPVEEYWFIDYGQQTDERSFAHDSLDFVRSHHRRESVYRELSLAGTFGTTSADQVVPYRNVVFALTAMVAARLRQDDQILMAVTPTRGAYRDCEPDTLRSLRRLLDDLEGPELLTPHYEIPVWKILKKMDFLPPLQSCNILPDRNCGKCPKCLGVRKQFRRAGRMDLLREMNER